MGNPLDWNGPAFLILYGGLFLAALILAVIIAARARPEGRGGAVTDEDGLAFLAGAGPRMVEAAVARLLAAGALVVQDGKRFLRGGGPGGHGPLDRALLAAAMPADWSGFEKAAKPHIGAAERRLIAGGLFLDRGEARRIGLLAALPLMALFGLGAAKLMVGLSRGKPVGFLIAFLIVTLIVILVRIFAVDRRTRRGTLALAEARVRHERLRRAPTTGETGTAVALFGTVVLAGSAFAALHQMRLDNSASPTGGGDGGGDGGGCGGGGCGGCGG